jgi:hypothetical protein|tara:strand:- start:2009 stop:2185 length:177 start_codon:yes stop_codon:yes gene_type:complete
MDKKIRNISISNFDADLHDEVKEYAQKQGVSILELTETALRHFLGLDGKRKRGKDGKK